MYIHQFSSTHVCICKNINKIYFRFLHAPWNGECYWCTLYPLYRRLKWTLWLDCRLGRHYFSTCCDHVYISVWQKICKRIPQGWMGKKISCGWITSHQLHIWLYLILFSIWLNNSLIRLNLIKNFLWSLFHIKKMNKAVKATSQHKIIQTQEAVSWRQLPGLKNWIFAMFTCGDLYRCCYSCYSRYRSFGELYQSYCTDCLYKLIFLMSDNS